MALPPDGKDIYQVARDKATQRIGAQKQTNEDALKRRFAALGGLNSGSAIKAVQTLDEQAGQEREAAVGDIDAQERQDQVKQNEIKAERDYQSNEAKLGRDFQSNEAKLGREFQGQQSDIDRAFQEKVFSFDQYSKMRMLDQADKEFELNQQNLEFNKAISLGELDDFELYQKALDALSKQKSGQPVWQAKKQSVPTYSNGIVNNSFWVGKK